VRHGAHSFLLPFILAVLRTKVNAQTADVEEPTKISNHCDKKFRKKTFLFCAIYGMMNAV